MENFVAYVRVSTKKQGNSGLGLDAQLDAIHNHCEGGHIIKVFKEVETGTSKKTRIVLDEAIAYAKRKNATLVIAKLDRLSRSVAFIANLIERNVNFVALDYPDASPLMLQFASIIAEQETRLISQRTKAALAQAKKRGVRLGNPNVKSISQKGVDANRKNAELFGKNIMPIIRDINDAGIYSLRGIADALNARGVKTARGGIWHPMSVSNIIKRQTA
tara:strand:+ start:368 stop:1021 length:654 start_codon:yes stop_codon:yes gene_type:complete